MASIVSTRDVVKKDIASILDYPSVYMGGPSESNQRVADKVLKYLERNKLLREKALED